MANFEVQFLFLLLFILCLHCTGIYFFTGGFLLTRTELSATSTCADVDESSGCSLRPVRSASVSLPSGGAHGPVGEGEQFCPIYDTRPGYQELGNAADRCWTKPLVTRVVLLIIDALRLDFVAPSSSAEEHVPWVNKLKILQQLVGTEGVPAKLFKFVADPPTTTLQRLKGLTTGGLPTFMDIGQSFGAPAIVEDNLLLQLIHMKKRMIMMGDDTWMQLFPTHFDEAYPFPSLNVKDLHTVDDGVIKEILPALRRNDWDLLIGHLLGVDHVGHIFGVESPLMVEKLRQYNQLITDILNVLLEESQSGGVHDNTLFIVMGDHGQTLNGDHGGGTPEEVETALFALATKDIPQWLLTNLSSHTLNMTRHDFITTFPQLDFASSLATIMGMPIPFGSVGQVNSILWSLAAGVDISRLPEGVDNVSLEHLHDYSQTLCINSWQVKRYLERYSTCAKSGFPQQELLKLQKLYAVSRAVPAVDEANSCSPERSNTGDRQARFNAAKQHIDAYSSFLSAAASLARAQWTQFRNGWMILGLGLLCVSLAVQSIAVYRATVLCQYECEVIDSGSLYPAKPFVLRSLMYTSKLAGAVVIIAALLRTFFTVGPGHLDAQFWAMLPGLFALAAGIVYILPTTTTGTHKNPLVRERWTLSSICSNFFVLLHTCSLFSNSYIVGEGSIVSFLMASIGILNLRQSLKCRSNVFKALCFLLLNFGMVVISNLGLPKASAAAKNTSSFLEMYKHLVSVLLWTFGLAILPLLVLGLLIRRLGMCHQPCLRSTWLVLKVAVPATYCFLVLHWLAHDASVCLSYVGSGNNDLSTVTPSQALAELARLQLPRMVFGMSLVIAVITMVSLLFLHVERPDDWQNVVHEALVSLLAGWSGTIMVLVGKKGPAIILLAVLEAWCLREMIRSRVAARTAVRASSMADWNLFAVQLFFCTGHRCTFDGLNYTAAFMGFDDFNFVRQGVLLALDTFGTSHVLPVFALPLLIGAEESAAEPLYNVQRNNIFGLQIAKLYLSYGLVRALTATASVFSAALQRRHLMVWGLFAPKYVFDAVGLFVTDFSVVLAMLVIVCCKRTMNSRQSPNLL